MTEHALCPNPRYCRCGCRACEEARARPGVRFEIQFADRPVDPALVPPMPSLDSFLAKK